MTSLLGADEARALCRALDEVPSVSIRVNRRKTAPPHDVVLEELGNVDVEPVEWCESGFHLDRRPDFITNPLMHAGAFYVQEAGSMIYELILSEILTSFPSTYTPRILDMCAAPGGKSTALLNALANLKDYVLVANEFDRRRASILRENLDKWGDPNVVVTSSSSANFTSLPGFFDVVAVDAPCSGEGMMRREPIARTQWSTNLVTQCAALQREILTNSVKALRPGGFLIYSTCTFNAVENEKNWDFITGFLGLDPVGKPHRFMPHRCRCEGLYMAVFHKPVVNAAEWGFTSRILSKSRPLRMGKVSPDASFLFLEAEGLEMVRLDDSVFACPPGVVSTLEALLSANIRIISAGTEVATAKNDLLVPSSRQALSYAFNPGSIPDIPLSRPQIIDYLRGNSIFPPERMSPGYATVSYRGFPLGLVKNVGNRANNLYPREWRIINR